jgi:choline dehydrogenase
LGVESYDYVIVGAGSAGCTLANRLSADPSVTVCLIEAGKKDNNLMVRMPAGVGTVLQPESDYNWGFHTQPQKHMNGRKLYWPRGKGWGGSSSINGMIYIRGHARDYDQWGQMGLRGWSYADVLPYFKRSESYRGGGDDYHGDAGPLNVEDSPMNSAVYRAFIAAGVEAGYAETTDFNGAQQEGFGPYQRTIHKGERWSASFAYLRPIEGVRDNLTVITTGRVTRVLIDGGRARGVEVVEGKGKLAQAIHADREVILCAGVIQSPQLLMLSGIGDPEHLVRYGIKTKVKSPKVGQNLQDHLDVTLIHEMTQPASAYSQQKGLKKLSVGLEYLMKKTGPGADNFLQSGAFLKSREGLEIPDLQLHFVNAIMIDHAAHTPDKDGFTIHACQLRPESRGTVMLGSADPFADPLMDPNYLATEEDRRAMRESVKMMRDVCAQSALKPWRGAEIMPGSGTESDDDIDSFVRRCGESIYHPVGTAAMGVNDDAPVDGELRVRGVKDLRVVDASVMPTLIGGNTNAPTIMIAEKASDMILQKAPLEAQYLDERV